VGARPGPRCVPANTFSKGEAEGKTLLDAMRVGGNEGMQHFDGEIDKLIRTGTIDFETGLSYATNTGNLRLELADFTTPPEPEAAADLPRCPVWRGRRGRTYLGLPHSSSQSGSLSCR